jgi:hypothetical protein
VVQAAPPFQMSPYLQERVCFVGQKEVYQEASTTLDELVGVAVTAKQIERVCHHFGALIEQAEPAPSIQQAPPSEARRSPEEPVYAMADGSMVLTRENGWREIKLGRLFSAQAHEKGETRGRITESIYTAHLGHYEAFLSKFETELAAVPSGRLVLLADGAQWFWDWASQAHPQAIQILDYYHCKGYLYEFAKVYFKDKKQRTAWIEAQQERLFDDQVEAVIKTIESLARRGVEDLIARGKILSYYRNNQGRMLYGSYRRRGLLIGSGPIEAAHRNVIQHRLKLAGQRWTEQGAQRLANLRVLRQSDRWDNVVELAKARKLAA